MKQLIICEKPSLAMNVSSAIKSTGDKVQFHKTYSESSKYIIVPAFGHLYELYNINDYKGEEKTTWSMNIIPFTPNQFMYRIKNDEGIKKQVDVINTLIDREDVNEIINCGDSDREGEIIIRNIINMSMTKKTVKRLWLPEQVESSIISGLKNMKPSEYYDNLANQGYARTYIDWLYGINLTVYASVKYKGLMRVGRVISAIVRLIYDKEMSIKNFKPTTYYQTSSKEETNGIVIELNNNKLNTLNEAMIEMEKLNQLKAVVSNVESKEKIISSPKLFSLSSLQNVMSKRYAFKPSDVLTSVQSLYEQGYVTYPRTPTEYLATAEAEKIKSIISAVNQESNELIFKDSKKIFNDEKIESHSAITPTLKIPTKFKNENDEKCYQTILNRFKAVFCSENHQVAETIIYISIDDDYNYEVKGVATLSEGWTKYEEKTTKDKIVPSVNIGDTININFIAKEKQTTAPKRYTVETLNNKLRSPFRVEIDASLNALEQAENDDDTQEYIDMLKGLEIGTEATRSGIIDKAIKSKYIDLKKSTYYLESEGEKLIYILDKLEIDMTVEKTAEIGSLIKSVYTNEKTIKEVVKIAEDDINSIINKNLELDIKKERDIKTSNIIAECPRCHSTIIETPKAYSCKSCAFTLWKTNKFLENAEKKITPSIAKKLIKEGEVKMKGLKSKKGTKYDCILRLEDTGKYVNVKADFGVTK